MDVVENVARGGIVGIEVRDHIVIGMKGGEKRSFSMKEKGIVLEKNFRGHRALGWA